MHQPEDFKDSTLAELIRISKITAHTERTSTGAVDRNYLLALGLLELYPGGGVCISAEGRKFIEDNFTLSSL